MSESDDQTWAGQPPPWLAAYGPVSPPIDPSIAGAPGASAAAAAAAAAADVPPSVVAAADAPSSSAAPSVPPPIDDSIAGAPGAPQLAAPAQQPFVPPWAGPATVPPPIDPSIAGAPGAYQPPPGVIAPPPAPDFAQVALDPDAPIADRQHAWQKLTPDQRTSIVNTADPKQLAAVSTAVMSPEDLATVAVRHQQAQIHEESAQRLALAQKTDEEARQSYLAYQAAGQQAAAAAAQLSADAMKLSQEKIDPKEHGVGHFIASVLTSAIGGAMSQYTGGRNLALEELDRGTQQRIEAQKANIANQWQGVNFKRNLIGEQLQRSGDMYRAQETYRVAQYDRAVSELQTKMQDYDPQGTTALRSAGVVQQIQAQRQQAVQAFAQKDFDNRIAAGKVQLDAAKAQQEAADKAAERKLTAAGQYVQMRGQDITAATAAADRADKEKDRQLAREDKLDAKNEKREQGEIGGVPTVTPDGKLGYDVLRNDDGKAFVIANPDVHKEVGKMVGAARDVNRLANQLSRDISKWGGQSDIRKSAHWQDIKSDYQDLVFALHGAKGIEGFRPGTAEQLHELTGDVDPTSFIRDASPGIQRAKNNVNADIDGVLRVAKYTGPAFAPPDTSTPPPPTESDVTQAAKRIAGSTIGVQNDPRFDRADADDDTFARISNSSSTSTRVVDRILSRDTSPETIIKSAQKQYGDEAVTPMVKRAVRVDLIPSVLKSFDTLEETVTSSDKAVTPAMRTQAVAQLAELAEKGPTAAIRSYAAKLSLSLGAPEPPSEPIGPQLQTSPDAGGP